MHETSTVKMSANNNALNLAKTITFVLIGFDHRLNAML